eukprot:gene11055-12312_t
MNTWSVLGLSSDEIRITKAALSSLYNKISSYQPNTPYPSPSKATATAMGTTSYSSYTAASLGSSTATDPHQPHHQPSQSTPSTTRHHPPLLVSSSPTDDLSILYLSCIDLVDHFLHALLTEMFSTKNEILYWQRYEQSNGWEKVFIQCNNVLYSYLRSFFWKGRKGQYEVGQQPLETLLFYVESLKSDFHELASILSQLARIVGDHLLPISELLLRADLLGRHRNPTNDDILIRQGLAFVHEEGTTTTATTTATHRNSSLGGGESGNDPHQSRQEVSTILNNSILSQELTMEEAYCLQENIHEMLASFMLSFRHLLKSHQLDLWNSIDDIIDEEVDEVNIMEDTQKLMLALQKKQRWSLFQPSLLYYDIDSFPLDLTRRYLQRPSLTERYFIRHVVCLIGLSWIGYRYILPFLLDTDLLKSKLQQIIESVSEKITEHVYEPLDKLGRELFETIRSRDEIVTKSDLAMSKEALQRMLRDYYNALQDDKTTSASAKNLLMDIKEQLRQKLHQNTTASLSLPSSAVGAGVGEIVVGTNSHSVIPSSSSSSSPSSVSSAAGSLSMEELALLDALMREYEKELQTPIRGILFGSLASSILIQMQKLKVHTEAAMLKMDQILASNELTIAATAAMPALGLFTVLVYRFRLWLRGPSSSVPQSHCLQLRMILADLERSLEDLKRMVEEILPKNTSSSSSSLVENTRSSIVLLMNEKMQNQLCVAEGLYFYHVKRLRDKVQEVLHYAQPKRRSTPVKSLQQAIEGSMKASRSLTFSGIGKPSLRRESSMMIYDNTPSILQYIIYGIHSSSACCTAFFHLLFGPAAELPIEETALRKSLEEDLNRLERPFMSSTCRPDSPFKLEKDDDFVELYRGVIRKQTVVQHMRSSYVWFAPVK